MKSEAAPIHVTIHQSRNRSNSKLDGMSSINTSPEINPRCIKRQQMGAEYICAHCFSKKFMGYRKRLADVFESNYKYLNNHLLTPTEAAAVPITTFYLRFESMGDVGSVTHARNYIRIAQTHPLVKCAAWSKNNNYWFEAFRTDGKPANLQYVASSLRIGEPLKSLEEHPFVDHVFTVYPRNTEVDINCGGRRCMDCLQCYEPGLGEFHIKERLK